MKNLKLRLILIFILLAAANFYTRITSTGAEQQTAAAAAVESVAAKAAAAEAALRAKPRSQVESIQYVSQALEEIILEYFLKISDLDLEFPNIKAFEMYLKTYRPAVGKSIAFLYDEFEELKTKLIDVVADDIGVYGYLTEEQIKNRVSKYILPFLKRAEKHMK